MEIQWLHHTLMSNKIKQLGSGLYNGMNAHVTELEEVNKHEMKRKRLSRCLNPIILLFYQEKKLQI